MNRQEYFYPFCENLVNLLCSKAMSVFHLTVSLYLYTFISMLQCTNSCVEFGVVSVKVSSLGRPSLFLQNVIKTKQKKTQNSHSISQ